MANPFLGEIMASGYNFAPRGWAFCNGQLLSIAQNTALFALLGTFYGGNGTTTFALPNLQSRVGLHQGQGPGLNAYTIGQLGGEENHTLISSEMPQHNHLLNSVNASGPSRVSPGNFLGNESQNKTSFYAPAASPNATMNPQSIGVTGSSTPHNNMQPYLVLNYCIALQGIFPSRN